MPNRLFANLIISCAAVLFLPQALECCHLNSHTILESLSGAGSGLPTPASKRAGVDHSLHERPGHHSSAYEASPGAINPAAVNVSLPTGGEAGQSPSIGAIVISRLVSMTSGYERIRPGRSDRPMLGRTDQPRTPPPRLAS